jgi:hypothetical protein
MLEKKVSLNYYNSNRLPNLQIDLAQVWLSSIPKPVAGKEMDSVFFNDDRFEVGKSTLI